MKWYYIINNKKENEGIQKYLFSKGYFWICTEKIKSPGLFPCAILFMKSGSKYLNFSTINYIEEIKKFNSNWYDCKEFKSSTSSLKAGSLPN